MNVNFRSLYILIGIALSACSEPDSGLQLDRYDGLGDQLRLTDHEGQPFELSQKKGKVLLLFFGFTHCPDICPVTLSRLGQVAGQVGGEQQSVEIVFVSVDPKRDTPERLHGYLGEFAYVATGLTGSPEQIAEVARNWAVGYEQAENGRDVDHTSWTYVIDREGTVRFLFNSEHTIAEMAELVEKLL
ncbi:MAG: SCO family protein [Candidatus Latescibacterota bacterium]|nr:SCO family protein [Candidatus Latescibacterota bacterium]